MKLLETLRSIVNAPWVYPPDYYEQREQRIQGAKDADEAEGKRIIHACDICSGRSVYVCPICATPIHLHSHENDFECQAHGFVNPIRQSDGAHINGDGRIHPLELLGGWS